MYDSNSDILPNDVTIADLISAIREKSKSRHNLVVITLKSSTKKIKVKHINEKVMLAISMTRRTRKHQH